jgi:YebC/PmpR family DNA-binding regulatory protein
MFARWAKNAKAFTKMGKELAIAVKLHGADPDSNPRLRMAIQNARSLNMPKDRIEAAIKRVASKDAAQLLEVNYDGYGPHGVAIIVETATDNGTRTVANVRSIFNRWNGSLGTTGSLDYLFDRKGVFTTARPPGNLDDFELEMIDFGLEEMFESEDGLMIYSTFADFAELQKALENRKIEVRSASLQRLPKNLVTLSKEHEAEVEKLVNALEEDDDVQHVYHNMQLSD